MANKKMFWLGILAMVLVFGMAVVGCDDGSDDNVGGGLVLDAGWAWTDRWEYGVGNSDGVIFRTNGTFVLISDYGHGADGTWGIEESGTYTFSGGVLTLDFGGGEIESLNIRISGNSLFETYQGVEEELFRKTNVGTVQ